MNAIYKPSGRAREYSPLALNIYEGCDHGCSYCFARSMAARFKRPWPATPHPRLRIYEAIPRACKKYAGTKDQVLISFSGDPYCHADEIAQTTRFALHHLLENKIPVAILTKGGSRCLRDLDLFKRFGKSIKVGASLTCVFDWDWMRCEPEAAQPKDRISALSVLHDHGIPTWASLEPVLSEEATYKLITVTSGYVDSYKVGRLNYSREADTINWRLFIREIVDHLRMLHKPFYLKRSLWPYLGDLKLRSEEMNPDRDNARPFQP